MFNFEDFFLVSLAFVYQDKQMDLTKIFFSSQWFCWFVTDRFSCFFFFLVANEILLLQNVEDKYLVTQNALLKHYLLPKLC